MTQLSFLFPNQKTEKTEKTGETQNDDQRNNTQVPSELPKGIQTGNEQTEQESRVQPTGTIPSGS